LEAHCLGTHKIRAQAHGIPTLPHGGSIGFDCELVINVPHGIRQGAIPIRSSSSQVGSSSAKWGLTLMPGTWQKKASGD